MDDSRRLRRLEELFHQTVDLSAEGRCRAFDALEGEDAALRTELERLLARADARRDLSGLELLGVASSDEEGETMLAGDERLGPYRLVERIGAGGMGEVFRAERADGQYTQTVAVKVIRGGPATPELRRRLRTERQILARLEHPNIARLLDGSVGADGSPYLVMEYVEGLPLTDACDRQRAGIERRLLLFRTVCAAVAHAHRNLVVHRDLKPSNILVTAGGEVKLLDFGIAKLLTPDDGDDADPTRTLRPLMTPAYASPEQVLGGPVTTATDVYALGLLLFELLCGLRAQNPHAASFTSLERTVCEAIPPRPSDGLVAAERTEVATRVAARGGGRSRRLRRRLRGDLDTIVAVALRKEPERRYASAQQLLEDLDRHLAGEPVRARPDTVRYRAAKFLRRHRLGAAATATIALALVVGLASALAGMARARRAELRALEEAATSQRISELLVDLFRASDPAESLGDTITAREILDRGAERVERLGEDPGVQARLLRAMSEAYVALGLFDPARELADRELSLARASYGDGSPEAARVLVEIGDLQAMSGDYRGSRDTASRALEILEGLGAGADDRGTALAQLGRAQGQLGELDAAARSLEAAVALLSSAPGVDDPSLWRPLNNLAVVRMLQGDLERARALFDRALAFAEEELGPEHPDLVQILNNLALIRGRRGDLDGAVELHERALRLRELVLPPDHPLLGATLSNLASALVERGDFARARDLARRALDIRERALGPDHALVASTRTNLGFALLGLGESAEAGALFEAAVASYERAFGSTHVKLSYPLHGLALVDAGVGRRERAEREFRRALAIREATLGPDDLDLAAVRRDFADFLREDGRSAEAAAMEQSTPRSRHRLVGQGP